jgi:hypothetical protein
MNTLASAITTFDQNKRRLGNKWNKQVEVVVDGVTKIVSCLINICLSIFDMVLKHLFTY